MNYVFIAASLDGYIAESDGGIEWLNEQANPSNSDYGYADFISQIDALIMGRNSFEKVLGFEQWPYEKMVFVLSSTLTAVPPELLGRVEIISGAPVDILAKVHSKGFKNLYLDGGQVVQGFLAADLVDEMILTRMPILLGSGIPLFGGLAAPLRFVHKNTEVYDNVLVKSHYVRAR